MAVYNPYNYQKPRNILRPVELKSSETEIQKKHVNKEKVDLYLEQKIMQAKPEELTFLLYDGLVKFIKKAIIALEDNNYQEVNYNSQRSQAILDELRSTLNMEIPLSHSLDALYEYIAHKLIMGNMEKNVDLFNEALEIAEDFKTTWREAFDIKF